MKYGNRLKTLLIVSALIFAADIYAEGRQPDKVIPYPVEIISGKGSYTLPDEATYSVKTKDRQIAADLEQYLNTTPLNLIRTERYSKSDILIEFTSRLEGEAYSLSVRNNRITILAGTYSGAFNAIQTLLQMTVNGKERTLECCTVNDSPRFSYRGLHFDVSRHFRSKEFLMKQIDAMSLLKLNKMHLHLTDGAGWRLEIEQYPRLTEFAAWRPYPSWTEWWKGGRLYCESDDPRAEGGYYTKEDMKELIEYARLRNIEVIPEIEMPGHSEEVIAAYPELSCSGEMYKDSDFCPGKEATFVFLQNVLDEVMELFPSGYVHIGGDEAGKGSWKTCPDCQRRMQEEGLKDVDELQSYLIHRIEEYVNSKGKKIIGWDEILQGGLAPNATVMSWRGTEGGIKAIESGHDVIMTPGSHCYFDYTQDAPFKEPVSIGGYTPLSKTYSYEPLEAGISEDNASHLLGIQGNLWSEYVKEDSHAEYMYYPRAFAIAETGWSRSEDKDYGRFRENALNVCELLNEMGFTTFDLKNEFGDRKESAEPLEHIGKGAAVTYTSPYSPQYPAAGDCTLTDGILGGWTYGDKKWLGFLRDMDVTVDLGEVKDIHFIGATFMHSAGAWVFLPTNVDFYVSEDGNDFTKAGTSWCDIPSDAPQLLFRQFNTTCNLKARYVKVFARRHESNGAWLFTDEIIIN